MSKGDLAHQLQHADDSQVLAQQIASSRTFGMIEGMGEYQLTEWGRKYFYPADEVEKRLAELSFLMTPPAFARLIDRYDGGTLPPSRILGNVLLKECGVPPSWVDRATSVFKDVCDKLGLIDSGGHLRYAVAVRLGARFNSKASETNPTPKGKIKAPSLIDVEDEHGSGTGTEDIVIDSVYETPDHTLRIGHGKKKATVNEWTYEEAGGSVRVETPNPLPRALWERLKRYVEILEPSKPKGAK